MCVSTGLLWEASRQMDIWMDEELMLDIFQSVVVSHSLLEGHSFSVLMMME